MKSEMTTSNIVTRSKLEHYGFNMLARPHLNKRQSLVKDIQNKRSRPSIEIQTSSVRLFFELEIEKIKTKLS